MKRGPKRKPIPNVIYCKFCNITKHHTEFSMFNDKFGPRIRKCCKECYAKKQRELRVIRRGEKLSVKQKQEMHNRPVGSEDYQKSKYLKRNYGIYIDEYNEMLVSQNFSCLICQKHISNFKNGLSVDHDHISGKIRGLLCFKCNSALGLLFDNRESLIRAIEYLDEHKQK